MQIHLGGSRSLSQLPQGVVPAILAAGHTVHVGCATGADQLVIQSMVSAGQQSSLVVFAACARGGAGAWRETAVSTVEAAEQAGAVVHWLAGGGLSVPLVARLMSRSIAALRGCSASVFFRPGPGSLAVAGAAVERGIPVYAFAPQAPARGPRGQAGQWVASSFCGFACWAWSSAQLSLF